MTVTTFFALAALQAPTALDLKVVEASVFKEGFVLVVREADLAPGAHDYQVTHIPAAFDGTVWYGSTGGLVGDVTTSLGYTKKEISRPVESIPDLLAANKGKRVLLKIARGTIVEDLEGTIDSITGSTLMLQMGTRLRVVHLSTILEVDAETLPERELRATVEWPALTMSFRADSPSGGKFRLMSFERGAVWAGSYLVDVSNDRAQVDGKAQLALGGLSLDRAKVKLLAGSPTLAGLSRYDLATGIGSADGYMRGSQPRYPQVHGENLDPFERLDEVLRKAAAALAPIVQGNYGGGGGFGGGGFGGQVNYDPTDNSIVVRKSLDAQTGVNNPASEHEDIYAYDFGQVTLGAGGRLTRPLFRVTSDYDLVNTYRDGAPNVLRSLRLRNDTSLPFTPGSCMVMKDGVLLATSTVPLTAPGQTASISLGLTAGIKVTPRTGGTLSAPLPNRPGMSILTQRKSFLIENSRDREETVEVSTEVDGKVTEAEGATVSAVLFSGMPPYTKHRVEWRVVVPARSTKEVAVTFEQIR